MEQSRAQTGAESARLGNSRGVENPRGSGSWRPPTRPTSSRFGNTGGVIYYRCRVERHIVRDCPLPLGNKCYQCGHQGHIARHCTQGPTTITSVGSAIGGGRGATKSAQQGQSTIPETMCSSSSLCHDTKG